MVDFTKALEDFKRLQQYTARTTTTPMATQEFDNTNKGSLFYPRSEKAPCDLSGSANIEGYDFYVDLFRASGERCKAVLVLKATEDTNKQIVVALFASTKGKAIMYGAFELPKFGKFYVNVLKKDRKNDNSPVLGLYFNQKDEGGSSSNRRAETPSTGVADVTDLPW